jgi:hypothetical protein
MDKLATPPALRVLRVRDVVDGNDDDEGSVEGDVGTGSSVAFLLLPLDAAADLDSVALAS